MAKKRIMDESLLEFSLGKNQSMTIDEDWYEHTIIDHLVNSMGYEHLFGPDVRRSTEDYRDVFIPDVLPVALANINRGLPASAINEAILKIENVEGGSLEQRNEIFNDYLQSGVEVRYLMAKKSVMRLSDFSILNTLKIMCSKLSISGLLLNIQRNVLM